MWSFRRLGYNFFFFVSVSIDYFCSLLFSYIFMMYSGYCLPSLSLFPSHPYQTPPQSLPVIPKAFHWAGNTLPLTEVFEDVSSAGQYSKMYQSRCVQLVKQPEPGRPVNESATLKSSVLNMKCTARFKINWHRARHGHIGPAQGILRQKD